jgi:hypothetical protein
MIQIEIDNLTADEEQRLYLLYRMECAEQHIGMSMSDFHIWLQER